MSPMGPIIVGLIQEYSASFSCSEDEIEKNLTF